MLPHARLAELDLGTGRQVLLGHLPPEELAPVKYRSGRLQHPRRQVPGPFTAGAAVQTAVTDSALVEFMKELRGIRDLLPAGSG